MEKYEKAKGRRIRRDRFEWYRLKEAKTKQTKSRYNVILKELEIFEEQYKDGVPEDAIAEICNKLQIDISIEMPFCENNLY